MKKLICILLVTATVLLPLCAQGAGFNARAAVSLFRSYAAYTGTWSENYSSDGIGGNWVTAEATVNGWPYIMSAHEYGGRVIELELRGCYDDLGMTEESHFKPGLNVYYAFMNMIYDLGVIPDNEWYPDTGLLGPYGIFTTLRNGTLYKDSYTPSAWNRIYQEPNVLEATNKNGVYFLITGTVRGDYEVYVKIP